VDARISRIANPTIQLAAIVAGTVLAPVLPFVGVPLAAAGVAGLVYRGHTGFAAAAAAVGVAVVGVLNVTELAFVAPVIGAVVVTVVSLRTRPMQAVAAAFAGVFALASLAPVAMTARAQGITLSGFIAKQSQILMSMAKQAMGSSASVETLASLKDTLQLYASVWPALYFQAGIIVGALVIVSVVWVARKVDNPLEIGPFSTLDLSPHVLWPFVIGLFLLAASYLSFAGASTLGVVGLNLLLCARTLFFIQGISVMAGVLDRAGVGLGGRIFALAAFAALDALTFVVSFTGLLDFWINFRRLPREGVTSTVAEPDGRRW
jgi:hypothetical protein